MKTKMFAVCAILFLFSGIVHAGLKDGLVAYYPFNRNANDESGNENNGTVRVTKGYRAIGIFENDTVTWFWIGKHDEYERFFS